jgi:DnaD/phage-associated family protein
MIVNFNFGNKVIVLPASILEASSDVNMTDIKVLLAVASKSGDGDMDLKALAGSIGMELGEFISSLNSWQKKGLIGLSESVGNIEATETEKEPLKLPKKPLRKSDEVPRYTTEELSVILEKRSETAHLIDECQQTFGKIFNTHEINILLGLVDYLALGWDYVLELLEFCARQGKHSINYVERTAFSFAESGVDTVEALKIKIAELECMKSNESFVRKLFGMKSRALTAKEKKCIEQWFGKFGYGEDVITRAYELTVSATNEPSVPYANAIIERWFSEGIKTIEDIDRAAAERVESQKSEPGEGSFDTDDFFESALRRSYNKK